MKKYIMFFLSIVLSIAAFAQTPADEIAARMNYVFAKVNKNNVPTGLLSNYGIQPIPLEYYNGVPADSNFVDLSSYKLLYTGVYSSKFNDKISLITPDKPMCLSNHTGGAA